MGVHDGHRKRMKDRFLQSGLASFRDHEVLELLLYYAIPLRDVNELAHRLIDHFGSLAGVFNANIEALMKVEGVGEHTAVLLRLMPDLMSRYARSQDDARGRVDDLEAAKEILTPYFFGRREETAYLLCMDAKYKLLGVRALGEGSVNAVAITVRRAVSEALRAGASVVILAHNHPSGIALPSPEDLSTTKQLEETLDSVGVFLWDHFIFSDGDMVSLRESGAMTGGKN